MGTTCECEDRVGLTREETNSTPEVTYPRKKVVLDSDLFIPLGWEYWIISTSFYTELTPNPYFQNLPV